MIFGNRIYGNRVLARVEALAREVHAGEDLVDCMAAFTTINMSLASHSGLDLKAIFKQYRKIGFSVDEGAISVIDCVGP
jgi:hypothetical protein